MTKVIFRGYCRHQSSFLFLLMLPTFFSFSVYRSLPGFALTSLSHKHFLTKNTKILHMAASTERQIVIDPFCMRQFTDDSYTGSKVDFDPEEFEAKINQLFDEGSPLVDGYAPFCKHLFVPNFAGVFNSIVPITDENRNLLLSDYEARTEKELPVMVRWFPAGSVPQTEAGFLDIILYSREQIRKENSAMGQDSGSDAPWGIVSVKPQDIDYEIPMQPITMMRNALGKEHGGSGVALEFDKYMESVNFWKDHATIK
mmetsp:Transcript_34163/g.45165  ORF Transcript_34163/g.45165 Transcript_34163/m.45165 type:complete len:256 (+) Transcript_34163:49-816(+)